MKAKKIVIKISVTIISVILILITGVMIFSIYTANKFKELSYIKSVPNSSLSEADSSIDFNIYVEPQTILREISPYIYGSSWTDWVDKLPPKDLMRLLDISAVRFEGNDFSRFDPNTEIFYKSEETQKLKHSIGEAAEYFTEQGAHIILQINMLGIAIDPVTGEKFPISSPEDAVSFIEKIKNENGVNIKYANLDNEPFIWSDTHNDLHPSAVSYDEYCDKFFTYAIAIKDYDETIMIMGPENCNPNHYYKSKSNEDRTKGVWLEYFLKKCREYEEENNIRVLDILTVHRYPIFRNHNSTKVTATEQQILNSTKDWWDEAYKDPVDPDYGGGIIPKLQKMIDENYQGTKLGITEYGLDYDGKIEYDPVIRAIWLADTLGIFAQNGVDYANYWILQGHGESGFISEGIILNNRMYGDKRPVFYSFYLMSNYLRGSLLKSESDNENIKVYSALNNNSINIIVINSDAENNYNCNIFADDLLVDEKSYTFKSKSITVFEINGGQMKIHTCDFKN
ncbi:MAG: glycoside hydrolase family 44 protein [Oscillospiraceae bacterium]|nr:glycoside hydrolase family 44 protein [Oscillospiraceae bacterium]